MNRRILVVVAVILLLGIGVFAALGLRQKEGTALSVKKLSRSAVAALLLQAKDAEAKGNSIEAKTIYQKLVTEMTSAVEAGQWQKKIEEINLKVLFSALQVPGKSAFYVIKSGDTLTKIAKEFNTTIELIKKANNLADDRIVPGKKLKVWTSPFSIFVDKSQNTLILKCEDEIYKTYVVSTGANNSTPVGVFKIVEKLPNPTWFKAGAVVPPESPENVLGTRWLGFNNPGYGIHGTVEPQMLGKQVTQGCVRMANPEVEELYSIVPRGTEVTIVD